MSDTRYSMVVVYPAHQPASGARPHYVIECGREYRVFYGAGIYLGGIYDFKSRQKAAPVDHERIHNILFGDAEFTPLSVFFENEPEDMREMNIYKTDLFRYLEGSMVKDQPTTMRIRDFREEKVEVQGKQKTAYVMYFEKQKKGAILNKTNAKALADCFGPETDEWIGRSVVLYAEQGTAFGKTGFWLRVRPDDKRVDPPVAEDDIPWEDFKDHDADENGQAELFPNGVDVAVISGAQKAEEDGEG